MRMVGFTGNHTPPTFYLTNAIPHATPWGHLFSATSASSSCSVLALDLSTVPVLERRSISRQSRRKVMWATVAATFIAWGSSSLKFARECGLSLEKAWSPSCNSTFMLRLRFLLSLTRLFQKLLLRLFCAAWLRTLSTDSPVPRLCRQR